MYHCFKAILMFTEFKGNEATTVSDWAEMLCRFGCPRFNHPFYNSNSTFNMLVIDFTTFL